MSEWRYLNPPAVERKVYGANYLDKVIAEFRFPTLLKLKKEEPLQFQELIRKEFPLYEHAKKMEMTPLGSTDPEPVYTFWTRDKAYKLELTPTHVVVGAEKYESYDALVDRLERVIASWLHLLDTPFFTRVGLRYINHVGGVPEVVSEIERWINKSLLGPASDSVIGTVTDMKGEVSGKVEEDLAYRFLYGLSPAADGPKRHFLLDYDYWSFDIDVGSIRRFLDAAHNVHFNFFTWSLGDQAIEALENGNARKL